MYIVNMINFFFCKLDCIRLNFSHYAECKYRANEMQLYYIYIYILDIIYPEVQTYSVSHT